MLIRKSSKSALSILAPSCVGDGCGVESSDSLAVADSTQASNIESRSDYESSNTMPTEGVEIGAVADLQFVVNKHFVIDLRVVQNFSNLLATNLLAESSLKGSNIVIFHPSLGMSFMH